MQRRKCQKFKIGLLCLLRPPEFAKEPRPFEARFHGSWFARQPGQGRFQGRFSQQPWLPITCRFGFI